MNNIEKAEEAYIEYKVKGWFDLRDDYQKHINPNLEKNTTIEQAFINQFQIDAEDFEKIKERHSHIQQLKNKFHNKRNSSNKEEFKFDIFEDFYKWYKEQSKDGEICCYCGVHQKDINASSIMDRSKRGQQRGNSIEIERVETSKEKNVYSAQNCRLACYVCNNAKSDLLTVQEFKPIADGINKMWSIFLKKEISMPTEVYDTFIIDGDRLNKF